MPFVLETVFALLDFSTGKSSDSCQEAVSTTPRDFVCPSYVGQHNTVPRVHALQGHTDVAVTMAKEVSYATCRAETAFSLSEGSGETSHAVVSTWYVALSSHARR